MNKQLDTNNKLLNNLIPTRSDGVGQTMHINDLSNILYSMLHSVSFCKRIYFGVLSTEYELI